MDSNSKSKCWKRTIAIGTGAALVLFLVPQAFAATPAEVDAPVVSVPRAIESLSSDLLGFGMDPGVSICNTMPIDATSVVGLENWYGAGAAGKWHEAKQNGEEVPPEMLEKFLFDHQGEGFAQDAGEAVKNCTKGGFCGCISVVTSIGNSKSTACFACCGEGSSPFCSCNGQQASAFCGCVT